MCQLNLKKVIKTWTNYWPQQGPCVNRAWQMTQGCQDLPSRSFLNRTCPAELGPGPPSTLPPPPPHTHPHSASTINTSSAKCTWDSTAEQARTFRGRRASQSQPPAQGRDGTNDGVSLKIQTELRQEESRLTKGPGTPLRATPGFPGGPGRVSTRNVHQVSVTRALWGKKILHQFLRQLFRGLNGVENCSCGSLQECTDS